MQKFFRLYCLFHLSHNLTLKPTQPTSIIILNLSNGVHPVLSEAVDRFIATRVVNDPALLLWGLPVVGYGKQRIWVLPGIISPWLWKPSVGAVAVSWSVAQTSFMLEWGPCCPRVWLHTVMVFINLRMQGKTWINVGLKMTPASPV